MKIALIHNPSLNVQKFNINKKKLIDDFTVAGLEVIELDSTTLIHLSNSSQNEFSFKYALFYDKDINFGKILEEQGIRLFNSISAIAKCDDKVLTYIELKKQNLPIIDTIIGPKVFEGYQLDGYQFIDKVIGKLGLPLIIKEAFGSLGREVYLLKSKEEVISKIKEIGHKPYLFQKFIASSSGHDIRINIIGNKIVAAMKRSATNSDFRSNISLNGKGEAYQPTSEEAEIALKATEVLGLDFAGVDLIKDNDKIYLIEVNSNVQSKSIIDVTGIEVNQLLAEYIKKKIEEES